MLQSPRLKYLMTTIGTEKSLFKRSSFEHKCLSNIKKIYQHAGKCDHQQNLKDVLYSDMLSNAEGVTDDSSNVPMTSTPVKNQVLLNHFVYSPTYYMLKRKQQNIVLELQNQNSEPLKWVLYFGPRKQN